MAQDIDQLAINTIRTLSIDAVEKANSGHPGTPMSMAPVAYELWQNHLRYDPADPIWPNRDRFVLSAGHASMLLYSLLHLTGVKAVSKEYESLGDLSVPLELFSFGIGSTLARLGAEAELRDCPPSPDSGMIADYRGAIGDPRELATRLEADPGVAAHGLFPPDMVGEVLVGAGSAVNLLRLSSTQRRPANE